MERSAIRVTCGRRQVAPGFAALHPGYGPSPSSRKRGEQVARMERSAIRVSRAKRQLAPGYASLHPGYGYASVAVCLGDGLNRRLQPRQLIDDDVPDQSIGQSFVVMS